MSEGLGPGELKQFLDLTHDGVWRYDLKPSISTKLPARDQAAAILERARLGFCNAALARIVGLTDPLEVIGRPLSEFLASDDAARIELVAAAVADGYRVRELEAPVRRADGRIVWTRSNIVGVVRRGRLTGGWGTTRDVTEQKAAEAALREAHANLSATIAAFPDLVFEVDGRGRILQYHAPDPSQLYTSPDAFLGQSVQDVLPPDAAHAILDALRVAVATGSQRGARYSLDLGGERRWFDLSIAVRGEERGVEARYVAIARDVTPGVLAREELRRERDLAQLYLDTAQTILIVLDPAGRIRLVNRRGCELLGCQAPDDLIGRDWFSTCLPERIAAATAEVFRELMVGRIEGAEYHENPVRTASGGERLIAWHNAILRDAGTGVIAGIVSSGQDITEQRRAEVERSRALDLLRRSEEVSHVGSWELDLRENRLAWSDEVYRIFGLPLGEMAATYEAFLACVHPDDRGRVDEAYRGSIRDGADSYELEHRLIRPASGETRQVLERCVHERDASGSIVRSVGMVQDITEWKAAQDARRESEERFRRIFEESPIGMVTAGSDFRFTKANAAFCRMIGYTEDELTSLCFMDITHPEHVSADLAGVDGAVRGQVSAYRTEKRYVRKDGGVVWGALSSVPIRDAAGKVQYFLAMIADVTAEKEAGAALAESERRFRDLANALPTCVFETDLDGRITYANQTGLSWFGYSEAEMLGQPSVTEMVVPGQREMAARSLQWAAERGEVPAGEYTAVRRDGTTFPALVSSRALVRDGRTIGVRGILIDISERVESAQRLERALAGTIHALAVTTEMRDPFTAGHQERVTRLSVAMGQRLGLPEAQLEGLRVAGLLHDVGKVSVPAEILSKPTSLSPIEMGLVRAHPETGHAILRGIDFPWPVAEIVLQHHERMDGSGYPKGILGDAILVEARILAVADTVEAMASHRPYRAAHTLREALDEIERGRGVAYDDQAARACALVFADGFRLDA